MTFLIAATLVITFSLIQENIGLNISDEGFLWNGVLKTCKGKIPTIDFHAYDPARYYWCAFWSFFLGKGILGIRRSVTLFQFLGLWAGLEAFQTICSNAFVLFYVGLILILWMNPRHKRFEHSLALMSVYAGVLFIEYSADWCFLLVGFYVGFTAFMGKNHGMYNFLFFTLLILLKFLHQDIELFKTCSLWILGIIIGYSPLWLILVFKPGAFNLFWKNNIKVFSDKSITKFMKVPFPFPWKVKKIYKSPYIFLSKICTGIAYLIFLPLYFLVLPYIFNDQTPLLTSSCLFGIIYYHHAYIRSDLAHLCQVSPPFILLVCGLIWINGSVSWIVVSYVAITVFSVLCLSPFNFFLIRYFRKKNLEQIKIGPDQLHVKKFRAKQINSLQNFSKEYIKVDDNIFVAPHHATIYSILNKESVTFSDYLYFPENEQNQTSMMQELINQEVKWIFIFKDSANDNDELKFSNTHPLLWKFINNNFSQLTSPEFLKDYHIFGPKAE